MESVACTYFCFRKVVENVLKESAASPIRRPVNQVGKDKAAEV